MMESPVERPRIRYRRWSAAALAAVLAAPATMVEAGKADKEQKELLEFAAEMAKKGNWGEARYRWERAAAVEPDNPFILNNIAVALEAGGKPSDAREYYARALALSGGNESIRENALRQEFLLESLKTDSADDAEPAAPPETASKVDKAPKDFKVYVGVELPPKLDVSAMNNILVASLLTDDNELRDINREIVRFLRGEFRRETSLEVLDVVPPPAVPEQRLEDLIANKEFWKHLGQQYDADLIVSGRIEFDRDDISGFRNVDVVSSVTGQKVRQTQFVEEEEFRYGMIVLFFDGVTGELLFRDEVAQKISYQGMGNDSLTAFFAMSDAIVGDILAVVTSRVQVEQRRVFNG